MANSKLMTLLVALCVSGNLFAQRFQVSTNAASWASLGTMNAQLEYGFDRHWSVALSGKYNPFTFNKGEVNQMQLRQRSLSLHARWWPWNIYSGWWVGPDMRLQEYNAGGLSGPQTEEGWKVGAGAAAGYSYMLTRHLNLDFGLRFWAGYKKYTVYECPSCGHTLKSGGKAFFLPDDLILSVSYVF